MAQTLRHGDDKFSKLIEQDLAEGVVSRAGTLFFTWSFVSTLYGILSIDIFRQLIPDLSMWENVWPRALFTSLPVFIVGMIYKKTHQHTKLKYYLTIVLLPFFLMAASFIHAWPLFWKGHYDFYLQFHASNIIAMTTGIFFISASPRVVLAQNLGFIVFYFGPLLYLFGGNRYELAKVIMSDTILVTIILGITTKSIHKLRMKLAIEDHQRRKKASLFLGKKLADAIYHSSSMVLDDFTRDGLVMSVDLRGYTKFMQSADRNTVRAFMSDYYLLVTRVIAEKKSYLHKTIGDGLLITFGVMESETDLSDLPEATKLSEKLEDSKKAHYLRQASEVFLEISQGLEELSIKHNVALPLVIGCGCSYGPIDVIVRGDESTRQELDIHGTAIVRSVRLEAYSKIFTARVDQESSYLLVAPELAPNADSSSGFKLWMVTSASEQVRDFPEIKSILFRQWKHNRARDRRSAA